MAQESPRKVFYASVYYGAKTLCVLVSLFFVLGTVGTGVVMLWHLPPGQSGVLEIGMTVISIVLSVLFLVAGAFVTVQLLKRFRDMSRQSTSAVSFVLAAMAWGCLATLLLAERWRSMPGADSLGPLGPLPLFLPLLAACAVFMLSRSLLIVVANRAKEPDSLDLPGPQPMALSDEGSPGRWRASVYPGIYYAVKAICLLMTGRFVVLMANILPALLMPSRRISGDRPAVADTLMFLGMFGIPLAAGVFAVVQLLRSLKERSRRSTWIMAAVLSAAAWYYAGDALRIAHSSGVPRANVASDAHRAIAWELLPLIAAWLVYVVSMTLLTVVANRSRRRVPEVAHADFTPAE